MTAAELFERTFARAPAGVWSAPGRVNLIGDHTDYNGGLALPFAIDLRTSVAAAPADQVRAVSEYEDDRWRKYVDGAVAELGVAGVDVAVTSTVPTGAGLSSSAALGCAVVCAVAGAHSIGLEPREAAVLAQRVENEHVGVPSGLLDQLTSMLARRAHAVEIDFGRGFERLAPFEPRAHDLAVLVVDTGVRRQLADGRYAQRRRECEAAAAALGLPSLREASLADLARLEEPLRRRARHVLTENERVQQVVAALSVGDFAAVGAALTASHASLRDDFEVSTPELDAAVEISRDQGALGARLTGGGFGGCAIALVPRERVHTVAAAQAGTVFEVEPADGARRDA
ncbi:MAG TPA: galactokinase [Gaiellaceae bacterium]|nr:galactokinase [Gaiellaceae bacterium]